MLRKKRIYLDYAAATPVCAPAQKAYRRAQQAVGNPGAIHREGVYAHSILAQARKDCARVLGCRARTVTFTSGGTESNNLAILGFARSLECSGMALSDTHWIVSAIEHPSVLACFDELARRGAQVTKLMPDKNGRIHADALAEVLRENSVFVSVGWANGEIGVVQPLSALAKIIQTHEQKHGSRVIFHTDAGQAPLYIPTTLDGLGADLLTLDSGKCYGPKGIGMLYKKDDVGVAPLFFGGGQERGLRAGSEPYGLAAGFAAALMWMQGVREREAKRVRDLRDLFVHEARRRLPRVILNGHEEQVLPHIVNISLPNIQSEYVTLALDQRGVAISTKSSCREGEEEESHVVRMLGKAGDAGSTGLAGGERAGNTLRFSLGIGTSVRDVMHAVRTLEDVVKNFFDQKGKH